MYDSQLIAGTTNYYTVTSGLPCEVGPQTNPGGSSFPPNTTNVTIGGGYWWNGWWYPWMPQPYPVPYAIPAPGLTPRQLLAIEALKLGTKIPKRLRDQALKILEGGLT